MATFLKTLTILFNHYFGMVIAYILLLMKSLYMAFEGAAQEKQIMSSRSELKAREGWLSEYVILIRYEAD